jgi:hypothetical protein
MKDQLLRLRADLGMAGLAALGLLALALAVNLIVLRPLEARSQSLKASLAAQTAQRGAQPARSGEKLAGVYEFLGREEATTDWLAKLHAIGQASGVALHSATYKAQPPAEGGSRIGRFEIVMPAAGTYPQLRQFIGRALAEIPVLSLDQLSIKRESRDEGEVHAELRMTLHTVKP